MTIDVLEYQAELEHREQAIIQATKKLSKLNEKIASLRLEKESLELDLIALIGHDYEGY